MVRAVIALCLATAGGLVGFGCGGDETSVGADDAAGTGDSSGSSGDGADDGDVGDNGDGVDDGDDGVPFEPYLARGITLPTVWANQGVAVPVVEGGLWVQDTSRNAELIKGRTTLIRGNWALEAGYEPREIEGKLTLTFADGSEEVATRRYMVTGEPSTRDNLDTSVWFAVPAELIEPGMRFQIEVFETAPGYEDLPEPGIKAYPVEPEPLGIESDEMVLRVLVVPVYHNLGAACVEAPALEGEALKIFEDELLMQNPAETVEISVREPFEFTGSTSSSFGGLLGALADLRGTDNADPGVYYYGLIRACDGGPMSVAGQAISVPGFPTQSNGWNRTSMGRWNPMNLTSTANTFVHEVGHTQGRLHVRCSGENGIDPAYPYEAGQIGVYGWGVVDFSIRKPNLRDYMTYCGPAWISDYGWRRVFPYIQEITSWDLQDAAVEEPGRLLVGLIDLDAGTEDWFETEGNAEGRIANPADAFEIETAQGVQVLPSTIASMGDGNAYNVVIELPPDLALTPDTAITRLHGPIRQAVSSVRVAGRMVNLAEAH